MEGDLTITIENARGLKDCDWFKRQDPYVEVLCAGERKRTSTHRKGGRCPHWNEMLTFKLHHETHLVARILDEDRHLLGRVRGDDEVGTATLDLVMARQKHGKRMIAPVYRNGKQRGTLSFLIDFRPSSSSSSSSNGPLHSSSCCFCNGSSNGGSTHGSICSISHMSTCSCSSRGIDQQEHIIASTGQGPLVHTEPWTSHSSSRRSSRHYTQTDTAEDQDLGDLLKWAEPQPQVNHSSSICNSICSSTRHNLQLDTTTADQQDGVSNGCSEAYSGRAGSCSPCDLSSSSDAAAAAAAWWFPTLECDSSGPISEVPYGWAELPSLQAMLELLGTRDLDHLSVQASDHHSSSKAADLGYLLVQGSDHQNSSRAAGPDCFPVQGSDHQNSSRAADADCLPVQGSDHQNSSRAADADCFPVQGSDHQNSSRAADADCFPVQGPDHQNSSGAADQDHFPVQGSDHQNSSGAADQDHFPVQDSDHHTGSVAQIICSLLGSDLYDFPVQGSDRNSRNSSSGSGGGDQINGSSTSSDSSSCASPSRVGSKHDSSTASSTNTSSGSSMDAGYLSYLIAHNSEDLLQPSAAPAAIPPSTRDTQAARQQQQGQEGNSSMHVLQQAGPVNTAAEPVQAAATATAVGNDIARHGIDNTAAEAAGQAAVTPAKQVAGQVAVTPAKQVAGQVAVTPAKQVAGQVAVTTAKQIAGQVVVTAAKQVAAAGDDGTSSLNTPTPIEPLGGPLKDPVPGSAEGMLQPKPGTLQSPTPAPVPAAAKPPAAAATAAAKTQSSPPPRAPPTPPPPPPLPLGPLKLVGPRPPPPPPKGGSSNPGSNAHGVQRFGDVVAMWQQLQREKNGLGGAKTAAQKQSKGGGEGGHAEVIDAIKQNSKYHAAVLADFAARAADISKWAKEVRSFQATTMPDLVAFIDGMELQLNSLKDEQQELKMFGDWPEKRYDTFRDATAQLRYLDKLRSQINSWSPAAPASCQAVLGDLQKRLYDLSCKMLTYSAGEDMMEKRFKSEDVPWPGKSLSDSVRVASLKYGRAYLTATTQEVQRLKSLQPPPRDLQQKQKQLLEGAVAYTYRLHSFVSGLDADTYALFKAIVELLVQLKAEQQQQEAMDSKLRKMSSVSEDRPKVQGTASGGAAVALVVQAS